MSSTSTENPSDTVLFEYRILLMRCYFLSRPMQQSRAQPEKIIVILYLYFLTQACCPTILLPFPSPLEWNSFDYLPFTLVTPTIWLYNNSEYHGLYHSSITIHVCLLLYWFLTPVHMIHFRLSGAGLLIVTIRFPTPLASDIWCLYWLSKNSKQNNDEDLERISLRPPLILSFHFTFYFLPLIYHSI